MKCLKPWVIDKFPLGQCLKKVINGFCSVYDNGLSAIFM